MWLYSHHTLVTYLRWQYCHDTCKSEVLGAKNVTVLSQYVSGFIFDRISPAESPSYYDEYIILVNLLVISARHGKTTTICVNTDQVIWKYHLQNIHCIDLYYDSNNIDLFATHTRCNGCRSQFTDIVLNIRSTVNNHVTLCPFIITCLNKRFTKRNMCPLLLQLNVKFKCCNKFKTSTSCHVRIKTCQNVIPPYFLTAELLISHLTACATFTQIKTTVVWQLNLRILSD